MEGTVVATYVWSAVSIDLAEDGSVWVAERDYSTMTGRIHHYSASGIEIGDPITVSGAPFCVRVNHVTSEVWIARSNCISRITTDGALVSVTDGGRYFSLAVDPTQGYVWGIGDIFNRSVNTFSSSGVPLSSITDTTGAFNKYGVYFPIR
jgi:hypothetical protein